MRYIKDASKLAAGSIKTIIGDSLLAPDANTVVVKAASPVAFFIQSLTYPTSYVVEKSVITQWGKTWTDHLADNGGQEVAAPSKMTEYKTNQQIIFWPTPA